MTTDNGSDVLQALWQGQSGSSFSMEPDEIQKRLSRFQAKSRDVKIIVDILGPAIAIWFAYWLIFTTQAIITRVGLLLMVLGMSFWVGQVWLYNRDRQKALANSDAAGQTSCIEVYRAELVRQRNFNRGGWLWSRLLALYAGLFLAMWEPLRGSNAAPRVINLLTVSILATLSVWLSYRKSWKLHRKIDAIDAMKQANGTDGPP
jgi:hypothetical protein